MKPFPGWFLPVVEAHGRGLTRHLPSFPTGKSKLRRFVKVFRVTRSGSMNGHFCAIDLKTLSVSDPLSGSAVANFPLSVLGQTSCNPRRVMRPSKPFSFHFIALVF